MTEKLNFDEWTKKNKYTVIAPTLYKKGLEYINIESLYRLYKKHLSV